MDSPSGRRSPSAGAAGEVGTFFESFDGWAQLIRQATMAPDALVPEETAEATAETDGHEGHDPLPALPWRPTRRPPIGLLHVVDDGRDTGETVRLRSDTLVVGRSTGGVTIHHDPHLEESHARLDRLPGDGWLLTDLGSRDGTWVRVTTARLRHGTRIQLGATRLLFRDRGEGQAEFVPLGDGGGEAALPCPCPPFVVCRTDVTMVASPAGEAVATIAIDDPFVSPIHAEVTAGRRGWRITNRGLNGLWLRLESPLRLDTTSQFQCGDQRFVLELPTPVEGGK